MVIVAGAVGVGVGLGLGTAAGGDDETPARVAATTSERGGSPAEAEVSTAATRTTPGAGTRSAGRPPAEEGESRPPQITVVSSVLTRAASPAGTQSQRARLTVRLRVVNRTAKQLSIEDPRLLAGEERLRPDAGGRLLRGSIPAGARATGELRFETSGAATQALVSRARARLRIAGRTKRLQIEIGPPATPGG